MTPAKQANARRLVRLHLAKRAPRSAIAKVASAVCGLDAEDPTAAQLALWARVAGLRRRDVERAVAEERFLVKTWLMHGRMHLISAADLGLYVASFRESADARLRDDLEERGVGWEQVEELTEAVGEALRGQWLAPKELAVAVRRLAGARTAEMLRFGWAELLRPAAARGLVCFGPQRGKDPTFVRPDEWVDGYMEPYPSDARAEVVRRFLRGYGPARIDDLVAWTGWEHADVKLALGSIRELDETGTGAAAAFALRRDAKSPAGTPDAVRLVGASDPYLSAFAKPDHAVVPARRRSVRGKPVVLLHGAAGGVWEPERHGGRMLVRVRTWAKITKAQRQAIADEAVSAARFLGAAAADVEFTV